MNKKVEIKINTDHLLIKNLSRKDVKDFYEYAKLDSVGPHADWEPHKSIYETRIITDSLIKDMKDIGNWNLAIHLKSEKKMIGTIEIFNIVLDSEAEIGYSLNPKYHRHGFAKEAILAVAKEAFKAFNLKRIYAEMFTDNIPSRKVCEACGFKLAKFLENYHLTYDDRLVDMYVMELTKEDFENENKL